jgi:DNA-binding NtrC family response regulator
VVAATNRELEAEVEAGRFREDLYFRINVVTIRLPPLRERPGDIPHLANHFLAKYSERERRTFAGVAPEAMGLLKKYAWPGNVRELENVIERSLALSKDGVILPSDLPPEVTGEPSGAPSAIPKAGGIVDDRPTLAELERRYIDLVLHETGGNKKRAAEILGIDRRTLYRSLEREGKADDKDKDED